MQNFYFRTEDIHPSEIKNYFVETDADRHVVEVLKSASPTVIVGSRGIGKSFLLRVAESELLEEFETKRAFPVYLSFTRASLIQTTDPNKFTKWMLARLCSAIQRALKKRGMLASANPLSGVPESTLPSLYGSKSKLEMLIETYENSWNDPNLNISEIETPSLDTVKEALEDVCFSLNIRSLVIIFDEAAHILLPDQQRDFFTLFRDLRCSYISCKAAVYPGITSFGDFFQPTHDATFLPIERDILSPNYISNMREIVEKQAESTIMSNIATHKSNFAVLAYAAHGNPRILLKILAKAPSVSTKDISEVIREYFRNDLWSEHSLLAERYPGYQAIVDWGRDFIENFVLPSLKEKNDSYLAVDKKTTAFFWIHRSAPEVVKRALDLLSYTGIITQHNTGIKATRGEIGIRYLLNLGCLLSLESNPATTGADIAKNLTPKRMAEFGASHPAYATIFGFDLTISRTEISKALSNQLSKTIDNLDITPWMLESLHSINIFTIGQILNTPEAKLQQASYVGEKRAREIKSTALAAVYEYISG